MTKKRTNSVYDATNMYIENTIIHIDKHVEDKSVKDAETTMANASNSTVKCRNNPVMGKTWASSACKVRGKKVRRGGRMTKHVQNKCASRLKIFSTNAASLINGKLESLKSEVIATQANIVTLQETHSNKKGKIKIPNFVVFEAMRPKKGGGTLIAVHDNLEPKLIEEYKSLN